MATHHLTGSWRMARRAVALACMAAAWCAHAQTWVPNETLVSAQPDLLDPEFSQSRGMAAWSDETGHLWVVQIDPLTGDFLAADGKGLLIDPDMATYADAQKTFNGPEWVQTVQGDQIVYTKFLGRHTDGNARVGWAYTTPDGSWFAGFLDPNLNRKAPYASQTAGDTAPRITTVDNRGNHYYRELWNASSEQLVADFPASDQPLRHVPGARAVTYTKTINGVDQAVLRFFDGGVVEQVTTDAGTKREVWAWVAPEFGGEILVSTLVNDVELRVYRKLPVNGVPTWTPIYSQVAPGGRGIYSPEPFTYNGKSYLCMAMQLPQYNFKSEVWVSNIDAAAPIFRRITDDSVLRTRTDPEVFITAKGPMIYYNRFVPKEARRGPTACIKIECSEGLYRADAGLGTAP